MHRVDAACRRRHSSWPAGTSSPSRAIGDGLRKHYALSVPPHPGKVGDCPMEPPSDPIATFNEWLAAAEQTEPNDANAMSVATVGPHGMPSVRILLLKAADESGFVFFTNQNSRKGREIAANGKAALCFHWKTLRRQVRVCGNVETV